MIHANWRNGGVQGATVLEAIEDMQWSRSILLEPDRIVIQGGHYGYWKAWWAEKQKKK